MGNNAFVIFAQSIKKNKNLNLQKNTVFLIKKKMFMSKSTFLFHLVYKQIVIESPFLNNEFSIRNVFL